MALNVPETLGFAPTALDREPLGVVQRLTRQLDSVLRQIGFRVNGTLPKDGSEAMTNPLRFKSFTTATRPGAGAWTGGVIFVSDAVAGQKFQGSDGTAWVALG